MQNWWRQLPQWLHGVPHGVSLCESSSKLAAESFSINK